MTESVFNKHFYGGLLRKIATKDGSCQIRIHCQKSGRLLARIKLWRGCQNLVIMGVQKLAMGESLLVCRDSHSLYLWLICGRQASSELVIPVASEVVDITSHHIFSDIGALYMYLHYSTD